MNQILLIITVIAMFTGCKEDASSPYSYSIENTIYSESNNTNFEELAFILTFKYSDLTPVEAKYIVTDQIKNIIININGKQWASIDSDPIDTLGLASGTYNNFLVSEDKTSYLVVAKSKPDAPIIYTAGDYANYLNDFITLSPGDYICEIAEMKLLKLNNDTLRLRPRLFKNFVVESDTRSSFLGEFVITIK